MRSLRYPGVTFLALLFACPAEENPPTDSTTTATTTAADSTTAAAAETSSGAADSTTESPTDDTTTAADSSGGSSSTGMVIECNQGQQCGNGCIEGTELCDCGMDFCSPAGLNGEMCAGLVNPLFPMRVYTGGVLNCNMASCQFDFATCTFCGDTVLNGNEVCELDSDPGPSCQALGMGSSTDPLPCGLNCQWDVSMCM
ncbi:MAG: hypothetical protein K0V04_07810 [Deltaproteobacteria bacterium]|nr:hypothetical protein [Deltaproteobacteria bacterium]